MFSTEKVSHILQPLTLETFLTEYFEKKPYYVARKDHDYYKEWFDLDTFLSMVTRIEPSRLRLRMLDMAKTGGFFPNPTLSDVLAILDRGGTASISGIEEVSESLAILNRYFEGVFYQPFQINSYYAPPGTTGVPLHFDNHDVFVLQIAGTKNWKVYANEEVFPQEKPLIPRGRLDPTVERELLLDVTLEPGDLLYMPSGFPHAVATGDYVSLHLAVGPRSLSFKDLFASVLEQAAEEHAALRASVPLGPYLGKHRESEAMLEAAIQAFSQKLRESALQEAEQDFVFQLPVVAPQLPLPNYLPPLEKNTSLRRNPLAVCHQERDAEGVNLRFNQRNFRIEKHWLPVLDAVLAGDGAFDAETLLPGFDRDFLPLLGLFYRAGLLQRA